MRSKLIRSKKETPPIGWCFFFGAGKFASQTYPAGELKSKGNRRYAASGGRSEPVSRKRRCLWFSKGHKQQCRDGVHPTKVPLASIPLPANNRKCCIFFVNAKQKEVQTRCLCLNTRSVFLTIEAGIPRIAVDNLWITGRQVRGPTFSVSILFPVKADALFLPPFTLSPPNSPRSSGICIAFLRSAMECGNANMLRFDEYGRMEVAA